MNSPFPRYLPISILAVDWARKSGLPFDMVLKRICEWAVAGGFREGAFVTRSGEPVRLLDIYMCYLAIAQREPYIQFNGSTFPNNGRWGFDVLGAVLVSVEDVSEFCSRTATMPPPLVRKPLPRLFGLRKTATNLGPPPCPDGLASAIRLDSRDNAIAGLNSLRVALDRVKAFSETSDLQEPPSESIDFGYWQRHWNKLLRATQFCIDSSGDATLQQQLDALDAQWRSFVADEISQRQACTASMCAEIPGRESEGAQASVPKSLRGRPPGVGSYEAADRPLVEEMKDAIRSQPGLSPTAAAQRMVARAVGGGTPESKAKRLAQRYSEKYDFQGQPISLN